MPMAAAESFLTPRPARVLGWHRETQESVTVTLESGGETWQPGQFNMLYAFGVGEVPISIGGDPGRPERLTHTVRSVGMVSAALSRLHRGQWAGVRGPYGPT